MRGIDDSLNSTGLVLSDDELLLYILWSLSSEYDPVLVNLTSRHESVSLQEAQYMLQSQELRIEQQNMAINLKSHAANVAFKKGGQNRSQQGGNQWGYQSNRGNYKTEVVEAVVDDDVATFDLFAKFVIRQVIWLLTVISGLITNLSLPTIQITQITHSKTTVMEMLLPLLQVHKQWMILHGIWIVVPHITLLPIWTI